MEQISIPLRSMYIFSISKSGFLTCFEFWVENVSRDIDNINVIDSTTSSLYDRFLDFCKKNNSQATSKIVFSKKTNKFFNTRVVSKRFGNTVVRVFVANK